MNNNKTVFYEMLRYAIVGGISAVVDMGVNFLIHSMLFDNSNDPLKVGMSVAAGFIVGLFLNFVLSTFFVFRSEEQRRNGNNIKGFLLSALVGVIGLGLTEGLTIFSTSMIIPLISSGEFTFTLFGSMHSFLYISIAYALITCVVKCLVLIWNFIGRKLLVYR